MPHHIKVFFFPVEIILPGQANRLLQALRQRMNLWLLGTLLVRKLIITKQLQQPAAVIPRLLTLNPARPQRIRAMFLIP